MTQGDTLVNAVIGALVTVVLTFLPFSPVLGGGVAGYLQKEPPSEGLRVGAYAGLIATIPVILFGMLIGGVFFISAIFEPRAAIGIFFVVIVFGIGLVYTVGLSALGGYLGAYIAMESEL